MDSHVFWSLVVLYGLSIPLYCAGWWIPLAGVILAYCVLLAFYLWDWRKNGA